MPSSSTLRVLSIQYQLALALGSELELTEMLRRFSTRALKLLGCRAACVWLDQERAGPGLPAPRFFYPSTVHATLSIGGDLMAIEEALAAPDGAHCHVPVANGVGHAFRLPHVGWLLLVRSGGAMPAELVSALQPVMEALARACRACLAHEASEQMRRALADHSARLDAVFALSPDGFVLFDDAEHLVYSNPAFGAMVSEQMPLSRGMSRRQFDAALQSLMDAPESYPVLAGSDDAASGAWSRITLNRPRLRVLQCSARRASDRSGELILHFRDVTHESEVDRMKSEFLSTAAHELRTPMVSIFGYAELLLHRQYEPERARKMLEAIHRQGGRMVQLINDLLDLARIEARQGADFRPRVVVLGAVVQDALAAHAVPRERMPPRLVISGPEVCVKVDPQKLQQAVLNLVSNAYKYSPAGTEVTIELLGGEPRRPRWAGVRVTDRGIGMDEEQAARAFDRFYRADPSGTIPGTGLGLSIVKEIIELHGGEVELASEPRLGTAVALWLPITDESPAPEENDEGRLQAAFIFSQ